MRYALLFVIACAASGASEAGSAACAACHRKIYDSYLRTPMAVSAGPVTGAPAGSVIHERTAVRYRVARGVLELVREPAGTVIGSKHLRYFVGSGVLARSYVLVDDGYLFEAPVAWYAGPGKWALAPGYDGYAYPYLTRPILPACLNCHASFLQPAAGTQNRYASPPFKEGGVACERCHGPGQEHIAKMTAGDSGGDRAILNPAKLDAKRRDSICSQCHLTGEVRVMRPGHDWNSFRPGTELSDSTTVFTWAGTSPGMKVTSHVENLAQSACKRAAGDRLWCATCHDPHSVPSAQQRVAWFRTKCQGCHESSDCKEQPQVRRNAREDCIGCHMPRSTVLDAQHVVYTDHSIPRRPREVTPPNRTELVPFGGGQAAPRDLALAWAIVAGRHRNAQWRTRATSLLERAERADPQDVEILLYLAELYRNSDKLAAAAPLYERALRIDAEQLTASVGLGGIRMLRGDHAGAIRLWQEALSKNSGLQMVRVNLAMAQLRAGDRKAAEATIERALEVNPGFPPAMELRKRLQQPPTEPNQPN